MSWQAYWLPHLIDWLIGGTATAVVGFVVGLVLRRILRELRAAQQATAVTARIGAQSAHSAAKAAHEAHSSSQDVLKRLAALEGATEGMKAATSASLAHRARDDLRFQRIEQAVALERRAQGGKHAAAGQLSEGD